MTNLAILGPPTTDTDKYQHKSRQKPTKAGKCRLKETNYLGVIGTLIWLTGVIETLIWLIGDHCNSNLAHWLINKQKLLISRQMLTKADKSQQKLTYADKSTYQQKLTNADIKADKSRQKLTKADKN